MSRCVKRIITVDTPRGKIFPVLLDSTLIDPTKDDILDSWLLKCNDGFTVYGENCLLILIIGYFSSTHLRIRASSMRAHTTIKCVEVETWKYKMIHITIPSGIFSYNIILLNQNEHWVSWQPLFQFSTLFQFSLDTLHHFFLSNGKKSTYIS